MKIFVVGANTITGRHLIEYIRKSGYHEARVLVHNSVKSDYFLRRGVETVRVKPTERINQVARAMVDIDAMVLVGSLYNEQKQPLITIDETIRLIEAARFCGVNRFIHNSFFVQRKQWGRLPEYFRPSLIENFYINRWLKLSETDYTIINTGTLIDLEGTGQIQKNKDFRKDMVPREDVARLILACLENDNTICKELNVSSGKTPIEKMLKMI